MGHTEESGIFQSIQIHKSIKQIFKKIVKDSVNPMVTQVNSSQMCGPYLIVTACLR